MPKRREKEMGYVCWFTAYSTLALEAAAAVEGAAGPLVLVGCAAGALYKNHQKSPYKEQANSTPICKLTKMDGNREAAATAGDGWLPGPYLYASSVVRAEAAVAAAAGAAGAAGFDVAGQALVAGAPALVAGAEDAAAVLVLVFVEAKYGMRLGGGGGGM